MPEVHAGNAAERLLHEEPEAKGQAVQVKAKKKETALMLRRVRGSVLKTILNQSMRKRSKHGGPLNVTPE